MYNYKNIVKILKSNQITAKNDFKNIDELRGGVTVAGAVVSS